ncbi:MAG TPA: TetR/AcrR family transcriptional regulator [Reyranella sp.]|nr:TetR/AcrR family transcriptional regulator [Reyranella sp.]
MDEREKTALSDGRVARGARTKREIVQAYIALLLELRQIPTATQVAQRAGYSLRTLYVHFADISSLSLAACDYAIELGLATAAATDRLDGDRETRIRQQVAVRAEICERWLPLWRIMLYYQELVPELGQRVSLARQLIRTRIEIMYRAELAALEPFAHTAMLAALESLTDFESWGRLREDHGLSCEEACRSWILVIDRVLPPTPSPDR